MSAGEVSEAQNTQNEGQCVDCTWDCPLLSGVPAGKAVPPDSESGGAAFSAGTRDS